MVQARVAQRSTFLASGPASAGCVESKNAARSPKPIGTAMKTDAKLGLLAGLATVILVSVVYYQRKETGGTASIPPAASVTPAGTPTDPSLAK